MTAGEIVILMAIGWLAFAFWKERQETDRRITALMSDISRLRTRVDTGHGLHSTMIRDLRFELTGRQ